MSKITYRIPHPTIAYGYVEVEQELEGSGPEDIQGQYAALSSVFQDGNGIGAKELAEVVYEYCTEGKIENGGEWYENASAGQKAFLNELKKIVRNHN